jgi:hypothetical protein
LEKEKRIMLFWAIKQPIVVFDMELSEQPISPFFKGQEELGEGTNRLSQNISKELPLLAA